MELNWEKANLEHFKKAKEQSERVMEVLVKQDKLNAEDYAYLIGLLLEDIKESEKQIKYYKQQLKKESDK